MLCLRPDPCPESLEPVAMYLTEWLGPVVSPTQLPRFKISYQEDKTEYLKLYLGSVEILSPTMLPVDFSKYDLVHVNQKADVSMQLSFIQACRQRGVKQISAGTFPGNAVEKPQAVPIARICSYPSCEQLLIDPKEK